MPDGRWASSLTPLLISTAAYQAGRECQHEPWEGWSKFGLSGACGGILQLQLTDRVPRDTIVCFPGLISSDNAIKTHPSAREGRLKACPYLQVIEARRIVNTTLRRKPTLALTGILLLVLVVVSVVAFFWRRKASRSEKTPRAQPTLVPVELPPAVSEYGGELEGPAGKQDAQLEEEPVQEIPAQEGQQPTVPAEEGGVPGSEALVLPVPPDDSSKHLGSDRTIELPPPGPAEAESKQELGTQAGEVDVPTAEVSPRIGEALEAGGAIDKAGVGDEIAGEKPDIAGPGEEPLEFRKPPKYRPPRRRVRKPKSPTDSHEVRQLETSQRRTFPINVRLIFERGGICSVSFLPGRSPELPEEVRVSSKDAEFDLVALQENWYEDVLLSHAGTVLLEGTEWLARWKNVLLQWTLHGREIYVLGSADDVRGYISITRLLIGDDHIVLCTKEKVSEVEYVLSECCDILPQRLTETDGLPAGWIGFRHVVPAKPLQPSDTGNILDCLRPSPDIEIVLRGGIRLDRTTWLLGYPPKIRLHGDTRHIREVTVDGKSASADGDGTFTAAGWDKEGSHIFTCDGLSRTYNLVNPLDAWEAWSAYSFMEKTTQVDSQTPRLGICGASVRSFEGSAGAYVVLIPPENPTLLGAEPGQIFYGSQNREVRRSLYTVPVPFEPVWAIPFDPLHADKRTARILLIGAPHVPQVVDLRDRSIPGDHPILRWCYAIRD